MKKLFILTIGFLALGFSSCGDGDGPEITITSPQDGDTFTAGDVLEISLTVTDDIDVASIAIASENFLQNQSIDGLDGDADTSVPLTSTVALDSMTNVGDFTIDVTAVDNDGNSTTESVDITVQ